MRFSTGSGIGDLPRFLLTRGIWLVLLELTVIRVMWTFNFEFGQYMLAGVIWVIGWSMILLAGLVRLPVPSSAPLGLAIIAGHNVLDGRFWQLAESLGEAPWAGLWKILYFSFFAGPVTLGADGPRLMVLYSIVPWVGVMAAGYAFGAVVAADAARRRRLCLGIGLVGHRAVPGPSRVQPVRRSRPVGSARRGRPPADAGPASPS